ncbi:hypothetical protein BST61_g2968 [Cercospora zeina]
MSARSMPPLYLKIEVRNEDWKQQVQLITVIVHTEGRWESSNLINNHVTQYLSIPGGRSVQINMRHASADDVYGRLEVVSRNYAAAASQSVVSKLDLQTSAASATVHDIVTAVVNPSSRTGFRDFCFTNSSMGCRYWHTTMACLYEAKSTISPLARERWVLQNTQYSRVRALATKKPGQQYSQEEVAFYRSLQEQGQEGNPVDLLAHQEDAYQRLKAARLQSERVEEVVDGAVAFFEAREAQDDDGDGSEPEYDD